MTVSIKTGVTFDKDSLALGRMLAILLLTPYPHPVTITAGTDGHHMEGSRHYVGEALDLRSSDIPDQAEFLAVLQKAFAPRFSVIHEVDHFHIQVRKGTTYLPQ